MSSSNQWFFALNGERAGPVDIQTLAGMIQSGRLPADVLICREGMEEWMPADNFGLTDEKYSDSKNNLTPQAAAPIPEKEEPNKLAYGLAAALVLIITISIGYSVTQYKKHDKEVSGLKTQMEKLQKNRDSLSSRSSEVSEELKKLKGITNQLHNKEAVANKKLDDLNGNNEKLRSDNKDWQEKYAKIQNELDQIKNIDNESDEKVKLANQRAAKAEQNAKSIQAQMDEIIKKAQLQAAQLQKQIGEKDEQRKNQIAALNREKDELLADLKFSKTNLIAATKMVTDLKKQLGDSPVGIGTPKGDKPPVTIKHFASIGSTDTKFNFAVINKGSGDGVKVGDTFRIESKESGETICHIKITRVQPMVAVGSPGTLNVARLTPGDLAYRE